MKRLTPSIIAFVLVLNATAMGAEKPLLGGGAFEIIQQGGIVMWVILAGSIFGLALAFERLLALRRQHLVPSDLVSAVRAAITSGSYSEASTMAEGGTTPFARILKAGLRRVGSPIEMEKSMESVAGQEVQRLKRPVRPIAILASTMPLLGLLGTILGMISTFNVLPNVGAADRVEALAPGIGQALYTTVAGLMVSIPFVLVFHYLNGQVNRAASEWGVLGTELVMATANGKPGTNQ
jgi:biopolymer transport protein ExbB